MYILTYSFVPLFSKAYKIIFRGILSVLDVCLCVSKRVIEQFIKIKGGREKRGDLGVYIAIKGKL